MAPGLPRRFQSDRLIVATHNSGKLREINALVGPLGVTAISAGSLGLPEPEETGLTFQANAELKALAAAEAADLPALADDSGLAVAALNGAPGIYSARWAGPNKDFTAAIARVERELTAKGADSRRAAFICALALAWPDGHVDCFEGRIEGNLVFPGRGTQGFGYDPIFIADGMSETFAEIDPVQKHAISHRARAFKQLVEACFAAE